MSRIHRQSIRAGMVFGVLLSWGAGLSPAYADCNFHQFAFGAPLNMVMNSLKVQEPEEYAPLIPKLSHKVVSMLGSQICPGDASFTNVLITYNFLADQLVSIQLQLQQPADSTLTLLDWAMHRYGSSILESKGPVGKMSAGQWNWNAGAETAFLVLVRQGSIASQQLDITSTAYQALFEQRWKAMEEMPQKP